MSASCIAVRIDSRSVTSPAANLAPILEIACADGLSGLRTSAVTFQPRLSKALVSGCPINPVPPVRNTFKISLLKLINNPKRILRNKKHAVEVDYVRFDGFFIVLIDYFGR